jgi:hypothetical protein
MKRHTIQSTGAAINDTFGPVTSRTYLDLLLVHVNTAPATAGTFQVQLDSASGEDFDTVLYALNLQAAGTTDILASMSGVELQPGDAIKTTYANPDGRRVGVTLQLR